MQELIRRSLEIGAAIALGEQIAKAPQRNREALFNVFVNESRAGFKCILPPLDNRRVLDLGCGSGITSVGLARWAREVVACDLTFERVAFLALRVRELGLNNVRTICAGDTRPLPFADRSFDCVVLNGVLEWSATEGIGPVREGQIEFLKEVRRILATDGHLYIGIENRYGYTYFLGAPEDHTGVKYAALAPRWFADILVKHKNGHPYRTYTYGNLGMRRLLAEAGFPSSEFFAMIPDYRDFRELYSLGPRSQGGREFSTSLRRRVKGALERSKWFTPSFGVVASPARVQKGWTKELADEIRRRLSFAPDGGFPRVHVSATSTAGLILKLGHDAVVRVPLDPVNEKRVQRNFEGLKRAHAIAAASKKFAAPRPLLADRFHGVPFAVESAVEGIPYADLSEAQKDRRDRLLFELLIDLKCSPVAEAPRESAEDLWRRRVVEPLHSIAAQLPNVDYRRDVAVLLRSAEAYNSGAIPLAFTHGDLWAGNVLYGENGSLALIDWDGWSAGDLATHDLLHFTCYRRVLKTGRTWSESFSDWLDGIGEDATETDGIRRFAERLALPDGWKSRAALAYWVREITGHPPSKIYLDPDWLHRMVPLALSALLRHTAADRKAGV